MLIKDLQDWFRNIPKDQIKNLNYDGNDSSNLWEGYELANK